MNYIPSTTLTNPKAPTTRSVNFPASSSLTTSTESLPSEERWWSSRFHLGSYSHDYTGYTTSSTRATFPTPAGEGGAIISHVTFAPNAVRGRPYQMAVSCGPRVCLYGGTDTCSLTRALARKSRRSPSTRELIDAFGAQGGEGEEKVAVNPDRSVSTGGRPVCCASYHADGRLLAVACDDGRVLVCDSVSRATLRTFVTSTADSGSSQGPMGKRGRGLPIRAVGWLPNGTKRTNPTSKLTKTTEAKKTLFSAGDDGVLRIWDLSGGATTLGGDSGMADGARPLQTMTGHGDAIRDCVVLKLNKGGLRLVTGSYDHTLRVWDVDGVDGDDDPSSTHQQLDRCVSVMNHGAPVERLLVVQPSSTNNKNNSKGSSDKTSSIEFPILISVGGTLLKLWNPITGTCLSTIQTKHSKTITSACLTSILTERTPSDPPEEQHTGTKLNGDTKKESEGDGRVMRQRLITAGLDGLIRIHSADGLYRQSSSSKPNYTLPYLHGIKTSHPITALAVSPDVARFVIGTSQGLVTVRRRSKHVPQNGVNAGAIGTLIAGTKKKRKKEPKAGTYSFFTRGGSDGPDADDHVVQGEKKRKLRDFDKKLKLFRYGEALDDALRTRDARAIIAVLEELGRRRGLLIAISDRDEETLEPLLSFTASHIHVPRHTPVLLGVANLLIDVYSGVFGQSERIDDCFRRLQGQVEKEVRNQKVLSGLVGQIDAVMYRAEVMGGGGE